MSTRASTTTAAVPLQTAQATFHIVWMLSFCHLLNDMMQSLIAAIYLDGGLEAARTFLLRELDEAIRAKDQYRAMAIATRYAEVGGESRPIFDTLLHFATSEDGALHAEKYYRTVQEEFHHTRSLFQWRQVIALARVTASEFGSQSPGYTQAKDLFKI